MSDPVVSVCCFAYNHAPFLRQTLDKFLAQKSSFPIEIIVHDDASTDGTTDIIRDYESRYPNVLFPIYRKENLHSQGLKYRIHRDTYAKACGTYIALCEGDDYWTDPQKLQVQVDGLESRVGSSGSYHVCRKESVAGVDGGSMPLRGSSREEDADFRALALRWGGEIHTSSFMFRRSALEGLPWEVFRRCRFGDNPLFLWVARSGPLHFLPRLMSVYREGVGAWSTRAMIWRLNAHVETAGLLKPWFNDVTTLSHASFMRHMRRKLGCFAFRQIYQCLGGGDVAAARAYLAWVGRHQPRLLCRFFKDEDVVHNLRCLIRGR